MSRLTYDSRSAAFITANSPFVDHSTKSNIAYRHDERKAVVVYYDGHAGTILRQQVDSKGDATNIFWQAVTEESLAP
jgi:prepilin-type processing-associated H-X9-DG protein